MNIACNVYLPEAVIAGLQQKLEAVLAGEGVVFKHQLPHEQGHNTKADIVMYPANTTTANNLAAVAVVGTNYTNNCILFTGGSNEGPGSTIVYYFEDIDVDAVAFFLSKALPQPVNTHFQFAKKDMQHFPALYTDGGEAAFILPAGFLQQYLIYDIPLASILKSCKKMVLPLLDCPPAPFSSFIIAEPHNKDVKTLEAVKAINNMHLHHQLQQEAELHAQLSGENNAAFTQTIFVNENEPFRYAVYTNMHHKKVEIWAPLPELTLGKKVFSSTEFMGSFFNISPLPYQLSPAPVVYVANYKAIHSKSGWQDKTVWAAGTKTWFEIAKKGIWVTGCADAFGLEYLEKIWSLPLHRVNKKDVQLLTNNTGAQLWQQKGWEAIACYRLAEQDNETLLQAVSGAELFFWTSVQQYKAVENYIRPGAIHYCPYGETAQQFKNIGVAVTVLPNIKAFKIWNKNIL